MAKRKETTNQGLDINDYHKWSREGVSVVQSSQVIEDAPDIPLSFESPESGTVTSARYDPDTRQLFVALRKAAVTYRYTAIDMPLWEEFVQAKSKGQFFAARIRPLYVGVRV